jgi:cysteine desulfuration protein SufE
MIVRGLLALVWLAYHGKTRAEMAALDLPTLLKPTGLLTQLSPNRRNGFASVLATLKELSKA